MIRTVCKSLLFTLLGLLLAPPSLRAEAGIEGVVQDTLGRPVQGALIRIHGPQGRRQCFTDSRGRYFFLGLVTGQYAVEVTLGDLTKELAQRTQVKVFKLTTYNIVLKITLCPPEDRLTCHPSIVNLNEPPTKIQT
jgi:hypothetical protein